eukprot:scaffold188830_cov68-Cyclotella_meneghiniana.AAC.2
MPTPIRFLNSIWWRVEQDQRMVFSAIENELLLTVESNLVLAIVKQKTNITKTREVRQKG